MTSEENPTSDTSDPASHADEDAAAPGEARQDRWLTPGVAGVGAASFFSDAGHEITTAVLPSFLTTTLHAGPGALGLIEGASDALIGVSKLAGGPLADDPPMRARLARGGYLGTALLGGAIGLTAAVWQVAILRAGSWVARGLRSPSRDALLGVLAPRTGYGRAYGLERAGDNLGAVAGPLLAAALVAVVGLRHTLLLAALPGLLAAIAISIAAREAGRAVRAPQGRRRLRLNVAELRQAGLGRALLPVAMFECGNIATTLLILRATGLLHTDGRDLAAATSLAILIYAGHNAVAAAASLAGGALIDRAGPRPVFAAGAAAYVLAYAALAAGIGGWPLLVAAFALAGVGIGLAETAESTLVARALPDRLRGSGFGLLGIVQAGGDLLSSAVVGLLWATVSPAVAFGYAAAWMLASLAVIPLVAGHAWRPR
ncbi:MFS family permease [Thermocatellispora tengchongensis]|uniref:MFS family permease n=1 Tax=Thermocatellispora tengchongensis TaxID=1073253 RepID=A0A840PIC8_9ACTN|nr:MFS transporter [Thermocatellispora tengchongensis]MBB5137551.1 MFS family permease [Thermocatellispora tengchongensis]